MRIPVLCGAVVVLALLLVLPLAAATMNEVTATRVEEKGRLLVQFRPLAEALEWKVEWQDQARRILATHGDFSLEMTIDSYDALVNGQKQRLEIPPRLFGGSAYVPLRFIAEAAGLEVDYEGKDVLLKDVTGKVLIVHLEEPV